MKFTLVFLGLLTAGLALQDDEAILVGAGEHTYEWVLDWPTLPEGMELGYTHGCIAVDSKDRIYLETNEEHAICVFNTDGKLLRTFGAELAGGLHGLSIVREGEEEFLYATHLTGKVLKLDLEGRVLWELGYPKESGIYEEGGPRYHPTSVAVASNGELYVADGYGRHWIHRYDKDQNYVASYGGRRRRQGTAAKPPRHPHRSAASAAKSWSVADRQNRRLQIFDLEGKPLKILTAGLRRPCHAARRGDDLVVPDIDGKVTIPTDEARS